MRTEVCIDLKMDYVVSIYLNGQSGKSKATAEKAKMLKTKISDLRVFSISDISKRSIPCKAMSLLSFEIKYFVLLFFRPKPNVIITRSAFAFGVFLAGKTFRIPVIREVHADILDEANILFANRPRMLRLAKIFQKFTLYMYRLSDGLIFNHPDLRDYYMDTFSIGINNSIYVYNGCNTDDFCPLSTDRAREDLGLSTSKLLLVFVGSVSKWHGVESMLDSFRCLERAEAELIVVGGVDADYIDSLRETYSVDKRIRFIGQVDTAEAKKYINAASLCLLPVNNIRISPGSPIKLYDYISCGKPVVAQEKVRGYSDLVQQYNLGIVCDFRKPREASLRIENFLNEFSSDYYLKNNRKVAEKYLGWSTVIDEWLRFVKKIAIP
jgi:glycosyltransferase involved in cell wall biosynthesis